MLPTDPQDLVKIAVEIIIDQIEKRGPRVINKVHERIKNRRKKQTYVPRVELVNRESEQRAIQAALKSRRSHILYFVGEGGAGKTRLLQIAEQLAEHGGKAFMPVRWGGLHDFYHTELHSVAAIQRAIVQGLDPTDVYFQGYRKSHERFDQLLAEGLVGPALEAERQTLNELFFEEYNSVSKKYRPVIAFDTLESLAHESDWVERLCKLEEEPLATQDWIISQTGKLENSVILMAGRPQPEFRRNLENANHFPPGRVEIIELNGLTREDARQYITMLLNSAPSTLKLQMEEWLDQLWHVTRGLPVRLALAVDLAANGKIVFQDDARRAINIESWGRYLISSLFSYDHPEGHLLLLLALARKGMTADLLHYLDPEQSMSNCRQRLEQIRTTSITKTRPGHEELFLHDALYELFDAYSPPASAIMPWYERLADYYRAKYTRSGRDAYPRVHTAVNLLYYELHRNPRHAFDSVYLPLREKALKGHELELDLQLRDEVLRFVRNPAVDSRDFEGHSLTHADVDRDGAIRWIKRYLIQSHYQDAIRIAEIILSLGPQPYSKLNSRTAKYEAILSGEQINHAREVFKKSDSLFWGNLLTCYGESLIYIGAPVHQTRQIIDLSIKVLSGFHLDEKKPLLWLQSRILGRAYNSSGYLLRSHGHYGIALTAYQRSLTNFNKTDTLDEQADTLNNLAFILALLGASRRAMEHVNQALELRELLGQKYPLGLSHNTRGLIYALQGQYELGRKESQLALNMFEELETPRGIGLAYNALGYILRKQGEGWKLGQCSHLQAIQCFQQSEVYFEQAEEVFSKQIEEPIRLWEAYNEQGSLYREWGCVLEEQIDGEASDMLFSKAVEYQMKALETARQFGMRFQEADTYDDLAKVSHDQGEIEKARHWLKRALSIVPKEYTLPREKKRKGIPPKGEAYWLILGKIYFQEGLWSLKSLEGVVSEKTRQKYNQSTIRNFTLAANYFEQFWPRTSANRNRLQYMADQILRLPIPRREIRRAIKDESDQHNLDVSSFLKMFPARLGNYGDGRIS